VSASAYVSASVMAECVCVCVSAHACECVFTALLFQLSPPLHLSVVLLSLAHILLLCCRYSNRDVSELRISNRLLRLQIRNLSTQLLHSHTHPHTHRRSNSQSANQSCESDFPPSVPRFRLSVYVDLICVSD
jgi:hypothetical protein